MPEFDTITRLLDNLTAVSPVNYQLWNAKGRLVFSTEPRKADIQTESFYRRMAKKVFVDDRYVYSQIDQHGFVCGLPFELDGRGTAILLALGPRSISPTKGVHPGKMMALLRQIVALEQYDGVDRSHAGDRPEPAGRSFDDLYLFANISKQFRSLRLKPPVIGKLLNRLLSAMEGDAAFLHFQDYPQYNLIDIRSDAGEAVRPAVVERIVTQGVAHCRGNYCIVDNSAEDERFAGLSDGPLRLMAVAVRHIKQHFGWMGLIGFVPDRPFQNDALNIMQTLANQLAVMAANMERYDDMERFTVNIVCSLVNAIESKDAYCQGHSKRVHQYVMEMARQMELPADETEALKWAAVLHDIGKIGIPEKVLCKPGKLTDKEFELIRQHPVKGKTILAPIRQLEPSMPAIAHHHERFDGSGYPDGLRGEEIPLAARMIAVADTYDALTSNRSYRETRTPGQALAVMERAAGTQLDPDLVAVFKTSCRRLCNALRN